MNLLNAEIVILQLQYNIWVFTYLIVTATELSKAYSWSVDVIINNILHKDAKIKILTPTIS